MSVLLTGKTKEELSLFFESIGEKKFRAKQLFDWIYGRRILDFERMSDFSKQLRERLREETKLISLSQRTSQLSSATSTKKYLFVTEDNRNIESVVIPEEKRTTLCLSTQVGCPLDCKFCATGLMGFKRNLTSSEIVQQYLLTQIDYPAEITNIVYMGMGEPLLNYEATLKSLKIFTAEETTGLSKNRITVSTSGITPKIFELADSGLRVKIALSLHSAFDDVRSELMPVNKKYPLKPLLEALDYYARTTKTRVTFEYTMFDGINDTERDIKALTKIIRRMPSKLNLIPFNSIAHMTPEGIGARLKSTPYNKILEFADKLRANNITVMVRNTQGDDIAAACGQLAVKNQ